MFYFSYSINGKLQFDKVPFKVEQDALNLCRKLFDFCFANRKMFNYLQLNFQVTDEQGDNITHRWYGIERELPPHQA